MHPVVLHLCFRELQHDLTSETRQGSQLKLLAHSASFYSSSIVVGGKLKAVFLGSLAAGILAVNELYIPD